MRNDKGQPGRTGMRGCLLIVANGLMTITPLLFQVKLKNSEDLQFYLLTDKAGETLRRLGSMMGVNIARSVFVIQGQKVFL